MPSLNQAAFLPTAIRSVLGPGDPGVELVVMDGGSQDGSLGLLADLATAHPGRLRWWSRPDSGPAEAVNAAVQAARAPLIGWLNADDVYESGAVARAASHLDRHPGLRMVYGEGQHIDERGRVLGPYPTRPADTPRTAFADGCFLCQPTAFFHREAFLALGGLDSTLKAAFDFDLWLRFFAAHPGRIAHLPQLQASTRLHAGAITLRMRERVALEGMQVVARHLGPAPAHWVLTHFAELSARHPFDGSDQPLAMRLRAFLAQAQPMLDPAGRTAVQSRLDTDRPIAWAPEDACLDVFPDGSAGPTTEIRITHARDPIVAVELRLRTVSRRQPGLDLDLIAPDALPHPWHAAGPGPHTLRLPVPALVPGQRTVLRIVARRSIVPAEQAATSRDRRRLAFRVESCRWLRASDPEAAA